MSKYESWREASYEEGYDAGVADGRDQMLLSIRASLVGFPNVGCDVVIAGIVSEMVQRAIFAERRRNLDIVEYLIDTKRNSELVNNITQRIEGD